MNLPKNDAKYHWTQHVTGKMLYYGLSADRIKRVLRNPKRSETGIAPETIAVMQEAGTPKKPSEIWVMYAQKSQRSKNTLEKKKVIITAWRYPGKSPIRDQIPIPNDILEELKNIKY
ncbi:hypothetical protein KW791_00905 [Candidatus Parcubacteria bacterium]|nr:hypothetical protein [Candidatus Parcubacteria bacterium]